ncbi:hypothetical protein [Nonomuraea sp. LPB2021202275-12-8]|uniref:hypothetical protein n=1 Tax=Nonomuraea sp. LPB2021202275-12-8 TaxID=3120159 RepID=UPI00300CF254
MYRAKLIELLTDPGQLALPFDHAEQLVAQIEDVVYEAGYEIVLKVKPAERPKPTVVGPTKSITSRELVAGVFIQRYTALARGGMVWSHIPCCPRWVHLLADTEREVTVRCQPCGVDYTVVLVSENDGGYLAVFEVTREDAPTLSRNRPNARPIV